MREQDIRQIKNHGSTPEIVESQIATFIKGSHYINLIKAASVPDDILKFNTIEDADLQNVKAKTVSFIPASGAASRMFKSLFEVLDKINTYGENNTTIEEDDSIQSPYYFFSHLKELSLCKSLSDALEKDGLNIDDLLKTKKYKTILEYLLTKKGLNYGNMPKALIPFHKDENGNIKYSFEEHICEGINFMSSDRNLYLHYTLSPEHIDTFLATVNKLTPLYEEKYKCKIHIETSIQSPSTDTIAVNPDNSFFRNTDGSLLFRPGGHGALIHNLNEIDADIILIKNIDNVVPCSKNKTIVLYRKHLVNYMHHIVKLRDTIIENVIDRTYIDFNESINEKYFSLLQNLLKNIFHIYLGNDFNVLSTDDKLNAIKKCLDRPIRICGVVKNTGEPGGGPFIANNKYGYRSAQIVESSQIDHNDPTQESIFKSSTHFNPVDLICMIKDYEGRKYDLTMFIDSDTSFISNKSKDGKPLKALELPGLWNGAMSNWITIFVEVPIETFNPVKTVNDLFRDIHI